MGKLFFYGSYVLLFFHSKHFHLNEFYKGALILLQNPFKKRYKTTPTRSLFRTPLCSRAHKQDMLVFLIALAVRPARHTQFGSIMSRTTVTAKSPKRSCESSVAEAFIRSRDSKVKNLSRTSGSFSGFRLATNIGMMSSRTSPTTGPVNQQVIENERDLLLWVQSIQFIPLFPG